MIKDTVHFIGRKRKMTKVTVMAGPCKFETIITAEADEDEFGVVKLSVQTQCPHYSEIASELSEVNAFNELGMGREPGIIGDVMAKHRKHATCPVPLGILKAVEVEAGLALPTEPVIGIEKL